MELTDRPAQNPDTAVRVIDSLAFVMDASSSQLHSLNEVGTRVWDLCDGTHTVEEIVTVIADEFHADRVTVQSDVLTYFDVLLEKSLIVF